MESDGSTGLKRKIILEDDDAYDSDQTTATASKVPLFTGIRPPSFEIPKSLYDGWTPPLPPVSEYDALEKLLDESLMPYRKLHLDGVNDYSLVNLTDFTVYRPNSGLRPNVIRPLNELSTRTGDTQYLLDGILERGNIRVYVERIPFEIISIDGYGTGSASVSRNTCIRSPLAKCFDVWYLLQEPSKPYERFHKPFCWLADFTKHFVGFLDSHDNVRLQDFRSNFHNWLQSQFQEDQEYRQWFRQYGRSDFRSVLTANYEYLWKEAIDVQDDHRIHPVWGEIDPKRGQLTAIEPQKLREQNTIVTPYVNEQFKNLPFAEMLEQRTPCAEVAAAREGRIFDFNTMIDRADAAERLRSKAQVENSANNGLPDTYSGQVVAIIKDEYTKWRGASLNWYAYVQGTRTNRKGQLRLKVIWLYKPDDTLLVDAQYPCDNELFFSDHCNCDDTDAPILIEDVRERVDVSFFASQARHGHSFFIRQKYITDEHDPCYTSFVTLTEENITCPCHANEHLTSYRKGSTVLIECIGESDELEEDVSIAEESREVNEEQDLLEPVIIDEYHSANVLSVRRLLRRRRDCRDEHARPNELVYSNDIFKIRCGQIIRECHVRFFSRDEVREGKPPPPYCYDGTGDYWILSGFSKDVPCVNPRKLDMIQGYDPLAPCSQEPLRGLSLFSGGGTFDRGLEDSGAVDFRCAVEWDVKAIHTYKANLKTGQDPALFNGSVNDFTARLLQGESSAFIPAVGSIDVLANGSPCQGNSDMQMNKQSMQSLQNTSMVTAALTAVDIYRPVYFYFENVFGLSTNGKIFSQIIATLVGMGYQTSVHNVDAWAHGVSQKRSRLFITAVAPGYPALQPPVKTHAAPPSTSNRAIGKGANGVSFGNRSFDKTPFRFVTALEATADLPWIEDSATNLCVKFPDHRVTYTSGTYSSLQVKHIPVYPRGSNWVKAVKTGAMPEAIVANNQRKSTVWLADTSRALSRVKPDGVFTTITTRVSPWCAMNGKFLHWDEPRILSLMEARRAQGIPDDEVLVGFPNDQWKIVGNSVARPVAVAFGLRLRESWLRAVALGLFRNSVAPSTASLTSSDASETADEVSIPTPPTGTRNLPIVIDDEDDGDGGFIKNTYQEIPRRFLIGRRMWPGTKR